MKRSVYLDTTILSYLFDERDMIKNFIETTKAWWEYQKPNYNVYTSIEMLAELQSGNYTNKEQTTRTAETIEILPRTDEIEIISEIYIKNFIMPKDFLGDAIHLSYASSYKIDFLLTWNCRHLANANKRHHIRVINTKLGLYIPEIITPLELFLEDENDY